MRLVGLEMVEHAQEVVAEVAVGERAVVVVAEAIAARIPGDGMKARGEGRQLVAPVRAVAADAVQEHDERALAHVVDGNAGRRVRLCF